jgi:hypothetical protein
MKHSHCVLAVVVLSSMVYSVSVAQGMHAGCMQGPNCGSTTSGSAVDNSKPSSTSHSSGSSGGSHSKGSGGGGGDPAADLSAGMHEKLAADNAARDTERDSLATTGAVDESNLNTVFNNATLASTNGTSSTVAAAELTGSSQSATSDSDFVMPSPTPNEGMSTPTPVADSTPSMPMAPMHDPGYTDVFPLPAGTSPSAAQIGASDPNTRVTGVDATEADRDAWANAQAKTLLVDPTVDAVITTAKFGSAIATDGLGPAIVGVVKDKLVDAVTAPLVEAGQDSMKTDITNAYSSYKKNLGNTSNLPTPAPGPTPSQK